MFLLCVCVLARNAARVSHVACAFSFQQRFFHLINFKHSINTQYKPPCRHKRPHATRIVPTYTHTSTHKGSKHSSARFISLDRPTSESDGDDDAIDTIPYTHQTHTHQNGFAVQTTQFAAARTHPPKWFPSPGSSRRAACPPRRSGTGARRAEN